MAITLSWDLFVIVFFAIVITYSLIIGKHESVKIVISTYIAIVAAQGIGNLVERLSAGSVPFLDIVGISMDISLLSSTKLVLFILTIVFLAVRGGFDIEYNKETGTIIDTLITAMFGFVTAGLMLSTLITFVADVPLLDKSIALKEPIQEMMKNSDLMKAMVVNQDIWFALPALVLVGISFLNTENDE
ncbi:hypothetical protein HN512_04315 [Candidatus Peregrinibacteria bacterium]|jgi:hypothetical protein|nr:hypothetical protein [Candidatus Peregrinibacteria bacterium]MBT3599033.1 hypothetical protein [Candidatus Peregrinibacteria bacterium]MBT4367381.1 hypothetical protein [Candidatus Peregrinibacteria bacterium]MBT4586263.1 hypothetical protein [Candidatus Peregrinibacteria bacterium]MBT6730661.1 hypothetical protein [Candidatus Peregrinibacteria bacterium]